jgi:aspartoacylase
MTSPIKRVLLVGGTHGNELTGVFLVKKFQRVPKLIQRVTFETCTLLANPKACEVGRRYIDTDLNRCFEHQNLENLGLSTYEAQRAKVIYVTFGTGGNLEADFVVDLHSTTSNMGLTVIVGSHNPFNMQLAAYLSCINPNVKVLDSRRKASDNPYLDSICKFGCTIEVGAVAQGVLNATLFQQTEELVYAILDYLEAYNTGVLLAKKDTFTIYETIRTIDYPRDEFGKIQAMVHPRLQFRDYEALHPGEPLFLSFDGEDIIYDGDSVVYPVFINEAAYYEKGVAMHITQQHQIFSANI